MCIPQSDESSVFGGISILAVGDFYQLSPVKAKSLVLPAAPSDEYFHELFTRNFKQVELTQVMRQRDDATFANILNRLRIKRKSDEFDFEAEAMLTSRNNRNDEPNDALHVYATNPATDTYNNLMVNEVCDKVFEINCCDYQKSKTCGKSMKLAICKKGSSSDLPDVLKIGIKARVMLTQNLDVQNGLVNGVFGTVVGISVIDNPNDTVDKIYVKFDSERIGRNLKPVLPEGMPEHTMIIDRCERQLESFKNISRKQFPLKLGYASTVHKTQGMTVSKIVYDMKGTFAAGQAYVALSRVTGLEGLYIKNLRADLIYRNDEIHVGLQNLPKLCLDGFVQPQRADLVLHNVQGLESKITDISVTYAKKSEIMCLTETWLKSSCPNNKVHINGFKIFRQDRKNTIGHGGVAIYVAEHIHVEPVQVKDFMCNIEIVITKVFVNGKFLLIGCIYRSPSLSMKLTIKCLNEFLSIVERTPGISAAMFVGDFNENLLGAEAHHILDFFTTNGYRQVVIDPTYISGSLLDAVYIKYTELVQVNVIPTYFSDHEAVEIIF